MNRFPCAGFVILLTPLASVFPVTATALPAQTQTQQVVIDMPAAMPGAAPYLGLGSPEVGPGGTITFHLAKDAVITSVDFDATFGAVHELSVSAFRGCALGAEADVTPAGKPCSVDYFLTPVYAALKYRSGALRVTTAEGTFTAGVAFQVMGPQVAFLPGTAQTLNIAESGVSAFALDGTGNILVSVAAANRVDRIDALTGARSTVAGSGSAIANGDGGPAWSAGLPNPGPIAVAPSGDVYVSSEGAAPGQRSLRRIDAGSGRITTVFTYAQAGKPGGVSVDADGTVYVARPDVGMITTITASGRSQTLDCSNGQGPFGASYAPEVLAPDGNGHLYFASGGRVLRVRLPFAKCAEATPLAGFGAGSGGDGDAALSAGLGQVSGLALDAAGDLFIADQANHTVKKVIGGVPDGTITTVAGTGVAGSAGDGGPATSAGLQGMEGPSALALDAQGNLYALDTLADVVRKMEVHRAALTFGDTTMGTKSAGQTLRVANLGAMDLMLSMPNLGTNPSISGDFLMAAGTCPVLPGASSAVVSPGTECVQEVRFAPTRTGTAKGSLTFSDNAGGDAAGFLTQVVSLSGSGTAIVALVATMSYVFTLDSGALALREGATGSASFTFMPSGGYTGRVALACSGLPQGVSCNFLPETLTADGSDHKQRGTVSLSAGGLAPANLRSGGHDGGNVVAVVLALNGTLVGCVLARRKSAGTKQVAVFAVLLSGLAVISGCGSGIAATLHSASTTAVTITATGVTAYGGTTSQSVQLMLTITQ